MIRPFLPQIFLDAGLELLEDLLFLDSTVHPFGLWSIAVASNASNFTRGTNRVVFRALLLSGAA